MLGHSVRIPSWVRSVGGSGVAAGAALLLTSLAPRSARADVSSWLAASGGAASVRSAARPATGLGLFALEVGMGTSPGGDVVLGGVAKSLTFVSRGTDLALALRAANGGFCRGDWGFALDAGAFQRWWGPANATGFLVSLTGGAPFGIQVAALFEQGSQDARVFGVTLGIDLMRFALRQPVGPWQPGVAGPR